MRRIAVLVVVAAVAALGAVVGIDRAFFQTRTCTPHPIASARPELQRVLDGVVTELAPGATAYVAGPRGSWAGAAGFADAGSCERMPVDARTRLESVSKIYTAALIEGLAQDGRLRVTDTVERWLPGLLPYGHRITIRQLLTMSSGLIDNNDFANATESERQDYLGRVRDPALRARLRATADLVAKHPDAVVPPTIWISWAAWQPLLFEPGTSTHYSNIGYDVLGLVAERAGGKPLAAQYEQRIFSPLGLRATAYDPQGPIAGEHARGYAIQPDGTRTDTTGWHFGIGAEGGIVANARETGQFLSALLGGRLVDRRHVDALEGADLWNGGAYTGCSGAAYGWSGGGSGFKSDVWVADGGTRVAVLLLNARHMSEAQPAADQAAHDAMAKLFCRA